MDLPLKNPKPDIDRFCRMIKGEVIPKTPPLAELIIDPLLIREILTPFLDRPWPEGSDPAAQREACRLVMDGWRRLGYDFVRWGGGLDFPGKHRVTDDTSSEINRGKRSWTEEGTGPIASWDDFEKYPWPELDKVDYSMVEFMARQVPEGMGLFICPSSGFLEVPLDTLLGYENMALLLYDDPKLVKAVVDRCGELLLGWYRHAASLPNVRGFFQGDDMGFKTQPLVGPETLRELILPWHKKAAQLAHDRSQLYLFHSCGQIDSIMDDLIDEVKIDAKHSFEDIICPVADFKKKYGGRVAVLGGIDVHKLCTLSEPELRKEVRRTLDACMPGGRYALGSGNSVANYIPVRNYLAMIHEGLNYGRV
jgi:uroporphyrinogen decarboxylase